MPGSANTHWLNSLFMKIFSVIPGDNPGYLRLHAVFAFPFFAQGVFRLSGLIKSKAAGLVFYCLVVFNPYLLDFFSLARGYGLALTFQAWSLLLFVGALQKPFNYRSWLTIILLSTLCLGGNLSYLYMILGMMLAFILYVWSYLSKNTGYKIKEIRNIILLFAVLVMVAVANLLFIRFYGKDLGYGGDNDFLHSLIGSTWEGSLYFADYSAISDILTYCTIILLLLICLYHSFRVILEKKMNTGFILCVPVVSIMLLTILFHLFFDTPFLYGRTALQWYVPGILVICYSISWLLPGRKHFRLALFGLSVFLSVAIIYHLGTRYNSRYCFEWNFQANNRQVLYDLYAMHPVHPQINPVLRGVYFNYYILTDKGFSVPEAGVLSESENMVCNEPFRQSLLNSDYIVTWFPGTTDCLDKNHIAYSVIKTYPYSQNKLIRILP